jgi:hypothetical protein
LIALNLGLAMANGQKTSVEDLHELQLAKARLEVDKAEFELESKKRELEKKSKWWMQILSSPALVAAVVSVSSTSAMT